ncbi:S-methyl-5-thioribose-1-phosphate isomerase [Actinomadura citrea]|jgi:methylthioribose-1-phosphate isomerase|uniref:Methylthioribose-1-phosphate isomerase n=1 Tax=Actinomadura citrea TaxID=46158 RepID=A0A7Y9GES7_9ACTN|nr:S-methyl-5-thioribose-1-phosphate isomerase [Actinomadura citrea]NYE15166.1 methylthioribose-1-phosphate isomerase [Actinomadura citrea]GGT93890.1 methylthioribose-1-phosphate isomerase [Actinomadura citrea]
MTIDAPTIEWTGDALRLLDQTVLPHRVEFLAVQDVDALVDAIRRLVVRGAPALGVAGAFGVAIAVRQAAREGWDGAGRDAAIARVREARPTAVNLAAGVDRVLPFVPRGADAVAAEAQALLDEDVRGNRAIGAFGADWILARVGDRPLRVLTHCNAGSLATAGWGTALGVVRELHGRGRVELVYADETRPLLQGARLTAWELDQAGIPCLVQADGAAPSTVLRGLVDVAVIGADRIAANGDTANKIGSVGVALACREAGIPLVVAAPWSTVDLALPDGAGVPIEERDAGEILAWGGARTAPDRVGAFNPAFDVTPARLVTALVTETGVLEVAAGATPARRAAAGSGRGRY